MMAMDKYCPKCDDLVTAKVYHQGIDDCGEESFNRADNEHIHYACNCGYDFTSKIAKVKTK